MIKTPNLQEITNLVELAHWQAKNNPDRVGFIYLPDGEDQEILLTYGELDLRARTLAAWLQQHRVKEGERALLLYPPGLDPIIGLFGCLYAGIVAVIVAPPRPNTPLTVIEDAAENAQATLVLTHSTFLNGIQEQVKQSRLNALAWFSTDQIPAENSAEDWRTPTLSKDTLALLVFSSGSTNTPKGVMITHRNILSGIEPTAERLFYSSDSVFVGWFPQHHITTLFWYFQVLGISMKIVFMPVSAFIDKPARWLRAVTRYRSACSGTLNFGLQYALERISPEERSLLDLRTLKVCILGGERVRMDLVEKFNETFANNGLDPDVIIPVYGLTENFGVATAVVKQNGIKTYTLDRIALSRNQVVLVDESAENSQSFVGCGKALSDKKIVIVDPESRLRCPPNQIGEIWISGDSIAVGYWNNPEETQKSLQARLADTSEGPFLRTGDLGFEDDGEIIITGRIKDMIILHGKNFYSQDFEKTVDGCHPALVPGGVAAFAIMVANDERLAILCELKEEISSQEAEAVYRAIRQAVGKDQLQSVYLVGLLKANSLPRTASGKVKRYLCREDVMAGRLQALKISRLDEMIPQAKSERGGYVAPRTPVERALAGIWSSVLGIDRIGVNDNFFELGGDSLKATQILAQAQDVFQIELPLRIPHETPTLGMMAKTIVELRSKPSNQEG